MIVVLAVLLFICVAIGKFASIPDAAKLALNIGEEARIPVSRLIPHPISISIEFSRTPGSRPIELGEGISRSGTGYIEFESPGAPIKILVSGLDQEAIFEALPSYGATRRDGTNAKGFVVFQEDGNPRRFPWPFNAARPTLPMGSSVVEVKVMEVTADLAGEQVAIVVDAPIGTKVSQPNYFPIAFLSTLWPVFAVVLFIYALLLPWSFRELMVEAPKPQPDKSSDNL